MKETLDSVVKGWETRYPNVPAFQQRAPKQKPRPYLVIIPAGDAPANAMAQTCEVSDVMIRAFSSKELSDEVCNLFEDIERYMVEENHSVAGHTVSRLDRVGSNGPLVDDENEEGGWMYEATYRFLLTKVEL